MEKISITKAIIVEGKYDKIKLEALVDTTIIATNGFQIFKDKEMQALIKSLASTCGIVVLTDSDAAGFKIRGLISGIVSGGDVTNVYVPDILGKEKRKDKPSAEGKLGVEGMPVAVLTKALEAAWVFSIKSAQPSPHITRLDLFNDGITGGENSAELRRRLFEACGLPKRLSTSQSLQILNQMLTQDEYKSLVASIKADS